MSLVIAKRPEAKRLMRSALGTSCTNGDGLKWQVRPARSPPDRGSLYDQGPGHAGAPGLALTSGPIAVGLTTGMGLPAPGVKVKKLAGKLALEDVSFRWST